MTQTGKKASPESRANTGVAIKTDDGIEKVTGVADVAEVAEGRLMIATLDGERDMTGGKIFGAFGVWKMWHEQAGEVEQFVADTPLTMPPTDFTRFRYQSGDRWVKRDRGGRIKRLKRADL